MPNRENFRLAFLVASASVLQIAESMIPIPIPGIRLGLANMITLVALAQLGFKASLEIAILRTICSAFFLGTFFSPGFIISLLSAVGSTLAMGGFAALVSRWRGSFSLIGISLVGAATHNLTQLGVVYLLFIHHPGIFWLLPWLGFSSAIMGWITGLAGIQICKRLQAGAAPVGFAHFVSAGTPETSVPHSVCGKWAPERKILLALAFSLILVLWQRLWVYTAMLGLVLGLTAWAHLSWQEMFRGLRRLLAFLAFAFLVPACFERSGNVWLSWGPLVFTQEGVLAGGLYAFRLVLFVFCAFWLARTTPPQELALGLKRLMAPFRRLRLPLDRLADVITLAWLWTPAFLEQARAYIRQHHLGEGRSWKTLIPNVVGLIATFYQQASEETPAA